MSYKAPNTEDWKGRPSSQHDYLYQRIECLNLNNLKEVIHPTFGIVGYAVDEGVRRNQGRVGASEGPQSFRTSFGKLANHFDASVQLLDLGEIQCIDQNLEQTQEYLAETVYSILSKGIKPVIIGGGHDIAYGHFKGIQKAYPNKSIGIVNFDAHLDLRPFEQGAHSGSPFNQIASEVDDFHYLCIGYRKNANPPSLIKRARELQVELIEREHSTTQDLSQVFKSIDSFSKKVDLLYITIDLDGFADCYAPGVSAPSPLGFDVDFSIACIKHLMSKGKVISVDLSELNPSYDIDSRTSKLAAALTYQIIDSWT